MQPRICMASFHLRIPVAGVRAYGLAGRLQDASGSGVPGVVVALVWERLETGRLAPTRVCRLCKATIAVPTVVRRP
jgi:hypothetical protein